jgi:hypothetical protein
MDGRASFAAPAPAVARGPVAPTGPEARRELMLGGPIVGTLLRLSAPTIVVVTAQALVGVLETYFVGFLGTDALAGVALVFPVVMLMQMMSAGGIEVSERSRVRRYNARRQWPPRAPRLCGRTSVARWHSARTSPPRV